MYKIHVSGKGAAQISATSVISQPGTLAPVERIASSRPPVHGMEPAILWSAWEEGGIVGKSSIATGCDWHELGASRSDCHQMKIIGKTRE